MSVPLRPLSILWHAKGWSRWQVEDILREQRGEGVYNASLGHHPRGSALVIKQWDMPVAAKAHLIQGVDEFIVHMQTLRLGGHQRAHRHMVDVHILGCHLVEDIPFREDPHEVALVENEQAASAGVLHGLDGLPDGGAAFARNRLSKRGKLPHRPLQPRHCQPHLGEGALLNNALFFLDDIVAHMTSLEAEGDPESPRPAHATTAEAAVLGHRQAARGRDSRRTRDYSAACYSVVQGQREKQGQEIKMA